MSPGFRWYSGLRRSAQKRPCKSAAVHNLIIASLSSSNSISVPFPGLLACVLTPLTVQSDIQEALRSIFLLLPALRRHTHPPHQSAPTTAHNTHYILQQPQSNKKSAGHSRTDISNLLSGSTSSNTQTQSENTTTTPYSCPTRITMAGMDVRTGDNRKTTPPVAHTTAPASSTPNNMNVSPFAGGSPTPKSVAFELLFSDTSKYRARLPMRVQIFPHDTTDSIVTTVKNFYGLYAGPGGAKGVSFEDVQGNTLIARYENLYNNMVVYVRVIEEPAQSTEGYGNTAYHSGSPVMQQAFLPGEVNNMPPPQPTQALNYGQPVSRPNSRTSRKRSISPNAGRGRRSASASANPPVVKKNRSRSGFKSRGSSAHGSFADYSDGINGYSSGDGAAGSVSSKTKSEHIGNTEISLDNIVEGGRRKRPKFESSVSLPIPITPI